jgi:hypothetical protein
VTEEVEDTLPTVDEIDKIHLQVASLLATIKEPFILVSIAPQGNIHHLTNMHPVHSVWLLSKMKHLLLADTAPNASFDVEEPKGTVN